MSLQDIVAVAITRVSSAVTQQGFSTPCILAYHTRRMSDRVHSYASLSEMTAAGYTPDDTAYKLASALWSQPNPPNQIKIGRRANAFTKSVRLTPSAANSTAYTIECEGLEATYTSDSSASVAEICTNLTTAINALADVDAILATGGASSTSLQTLSGASLNGVLGYRALSPSRRITLVLSNHADWDASTATITGKDANGTTITDTLSIPNGGNATLTTTKLFARVTSVAIPVQSGTGGTFTVGVAAPYTATDGTTHIDLEAPAGLIPSLEITAGDLELEDRTTDPGLASDVTAIRAEDDDWYCALLDSNSSAEILALAAIIEPLTPKKILVAQSADIAVLDPDSITDVAYLVADRDYFRTHVSFHPGIATANSWIAAALVGNALAYSPGSVTWVNRELVGVSSWGPTSADRTALLAKNCGSIETVAGRKVTFGGKVGGGEWLDIIHGLDWLHARIGERIFGLLVSAQGDKIGFTDKGIARVHAELRAQLTEASAPPSNLLATWSTTVPTAASLSSSQRGTRVLPSVTFNATV
jgi:hypothetical protein